MKTKTSLNHKTTSTPKPLLSYCAFTGLQAQYRIGIIEYNKKRIARDFGAVVADKVLDAIDNIQNHFFGTKYWPVVMDLNGSIIYRADLADCDKLSAKEGWRQFIENYDNSK